MKNASLVDTVTSQGSWRESPLTNRSKGVRGVRRAAAPSMWAAGHVDKKPAFAPLAPHSAVPRPEERVQTSAPVFPGNPLLKGTLETYILNFALKV